MDDMIDARRRAVYAAAEQEGWLDGERSAIGARIPKRLIDAARKQAGVTSITEIVEYALAKMALEDDYGAKLLAREGSIPRDIDLEF
jgi:hypothetical protein